MLLFGILAIEAKRHARTVHTVLKMVNARWGRAVHLILLFSCIRAYVIITSISAMICGGVSTTYISTRRRTPDFA